MTTCVTDFYQEGVIRVTWASLLTTENGDAATISRWPTKSVQVLGTSGDGGTITIQGSNDGSTWTTLTDSAGTELSGLDDGDLMDILQNPLYIRPTVVSGDQDTDFLVILIGV